jgi:CubicO group peptidase (beta-lactamase class C family)
VSIDDARRIVDEARTEDVFPAATVEVGSSAGPMWSEAFGVDLSTPFDLASLTKVVATTTVVMELIRRGAIALDARVCEYIAEWRAVDRDRVTVRALLEHASGLPARLFDAPPRGRREFEHEICTSPLEYPPRTRSLYSDLGFILLGFLAADRGGAPLDELFHQITIQLRRVVERAPGVAEALETPDILTFSLPAELRRFAAATKPMNEDARRGRMLVGEVHDNYAAALGGVAGHAGLFGSAGGVGAFARAILRAARGDATIPAPLSPERVRQFVRRGAVPGSSRALGWDTMLPTSSCGSRMSPDAFGHVGYTGTSLWIDPARDRYFVLLTNRVAGDGTLDQMRDVRRAFHDALADV